MFALTPCAVKPEPRTDSNHCRRYPAKLQLFAKPVTWWMPVILAKISYRPELWIVPGVQRFANLWCTFGSFRTSEKHEKRSFRRKFRGFANLKSAHRSRSFAPQQLKPFKGASRFRKPRINAHKQQIRTIQLNLFFALRRCPFRDGILRVLFHRLRRQPLSGHHARRAFLHFSGFVRNFIAFCSLSMAFFAKTLYNSF